MNTRIRAALVSKLPAAAIVVAIALVLPEPLPAAPAAREVERAPGRVVTVARTRNVCFSDTLQVTGVLVPRNEVLVRPDREGLQVSQVQVEPGDAVVAGQVLARLERPDGPGGQATGPGVAVRAPAAGTVVASSAVVGAMASGRGQPLFRIAELGEMELLAETPAATLADLAPNQAAAVEIVGIGSLPGRVRLISGTINQATQLGQVRVFVGSDAQLRAGAFGRARIDIEQRCGPAVPLSAVLHGSGGPVVQVVRDGRIESRRVKVGLIASGQAEIRDGLAEGDMVVARAGAFLRDGDRVRAVEAKEPADPAK